MSGLEQAIRNALERADRANPEIRSRIYQSARNALEAGLRKQDINDPAVIERQKQRLEITIQAIEREELERLRAAARLEKILIENGPDPDEERLPGGEPEAVTEENDEPAPVAVAEVPRAERVAEPSLDIPEARPHGAEPQLHEPRDVPPPPAEEDESSLAGLSAGRDDAPVAAAPDLAAERLVRPPHEERKAGRKRKRERREEEDRAWAEPSTPEGRRIAPDRREKRRRSGSLIVSLFVYLVLLATIAGGVWWVYATGMLKAAIEGTGDFELVPRELQAEDFDPAAENETRLDPLRRFSGDWVDIFKPGESQAAVTPGRQAKISEASDSDGKAIMIASEAPDQDGEVRIEVPASILQELAGKTSTIAITLRADSELPSQIYVQCEFSTLGGCGRHRFTVSNERADELIQVKFDGKLGPSEPGHIVINSDLTGEGRAIRLYGVRVLPGS